ncbi:MAG: hypothetical protein ACW99U_01610 [Candidatus Thorarchaeota archaeon]
MNVGRVVLVAVVVLLVLTGSIQSSGPSFDLTWMPGSPISLETAPAHWGLRQSSETLAQDTVFGNYSTDYTSSQYNPVTPAVEIEAYDPDGIDTVWFFYRLTNNSVGQNQTMEPIEWERPNTYRGHFLAYVTNAVTDWAIRFYANDSNGVVSVSEEYILRVYFNPPNTLPADGADYVIYGVIIAIPLLTILIAVLARKRS